MRTPRRGPAPALAAPSPAPPHRPAAPDRPVRRAVFLAAARPWPPSPTCSTASSGTRAPSAPPSAPPPRARQGNPHRPTPLAQATIRITGLGQLSWTAAAADRRRHRPGGHRGGRRRDRLAHRRRGAAPAAHDHRRRPADLRQQPERAAGLARTRRRAQGTRRHPRQPVRAAGSLLRRPAALRRQRLPRAAHPADPRTHPAPGHRADPAATTGTWQAVSRNCSPPTPSKNTSSRRCSPWPAAKPAPPRASPPTWPPSPAPPWPPPAPRSAAWPARPDRHPAGRPRR